MVPQRWRARWAKLRSHPRPARLLASRVLWRTGLSSWWTITLTGGTRLRFYPSSISAGLWASPDDRREDVEILRRILRPGDTYVDCGANVGHLVIVARHIVGDLGRVTAIEANPRIASYCRGNLALNGYHDVIVRNVAVGDTQGHGRISDRRADEQNSLSTDGTEVAMAVLDDLVKEPVTLLKIDVEGYELPVLRGARRVLQSADFVYCELSASNCARFGYEPGDVEDLLLAAGFAFARPRERRWEILHERVYETLSKRDLPSTGFNLLAVNTSSLAELTRRLESRVE
jgi:FkbM family methyltransferase